MHTELQKLVSNPEVLAIFKTIFPGVSVNRLKEIKKGISWYHPISALTKDAHVYTKGGWRFTPKLFGRLGNVFDQGVENGRMPEFEAALIDLARAPFEVRCSASDPDNDGEWLSFPFERNPDGITFTTDGPLAYMFPFQWEVHQFSLLWDTKVHRGFPITIPNHPKPSGTRTSFGNNYQFHVKCTETTRLAILLQQDDKKLEEILVCVAAARGPFKINQFDEDLLMEPVSLLRKNREVSLFISLPPGDYLVIPCTFRARLTHVHRFFLDIHANKPINARFVTP